MKATGKFFILKQLLIILFSFLILASCSVQKQIRTSAKLVINDSSLRTAHVGISIYEPAANKYWYNYQGDHYFIPASNTKIPTCYAAMKYLGDSLTGLLKIENDTSIYFLPAADPTLLHPDFISQPVITYLRSTNKKIYTTDIKWEENALGYGWSWDDYNEDYMAERSPLPVYGNLISWIQEKNYEDHVFSYSVPEVNWQVNFDTSKSSHFLVKRNRDQNIYTITEGNEKFKKQDIPFITNKLNTSLELLTDTIHKSLNLITTEMFSSDKTAQLIKIKTQPTDSLLRPMMHNSDNFFAEQTLLMVSNAKLGIMNDEKIIDTLLKTDFKDLPQKPRWVDGSGLSRYNLFTPQDFVAIFNKIKNEFGIDRIKVILPTGGTGTLENYYKDESDYIFAKTGTLSGIVTLSGFLYTKKSKLLIFSILINNHQSSATAVRKATEKFIKRIRQKF